MELPRCETQAHLRDGVEVLHDVQVNFCRKSVPLAVGISCELAGFLCYSTKACFGRGRGASQACLRNTLRFSVEIFRKRRGLRRKNEVAATV